MKKLLVCTLALGMASQLCAKESSKIITVTNATTHKVKITCYSAVLCQYADEARDMDPAEIRVFEVWNYRGSYSNNFRYFWFSIPGITGSFRIDADSEKSFYTLIEKDGKLTAVGS